VTDAIEPAALEGLIGREQGVSGWIEIDQARIDAFAATTGDEQFIHVNPEAAKLTPFGGTIAHGFLTLSLLSVMAMEAAPPPAGTVMGINYGFDRLRFLTPVRSGARVRGRFTLKAVEAREAGRWLLTHEATVEIEGMEKPALIADWLTLYVTRQ
jgi:acyl dehydratase